MKKPIIIEIFVWTVFLTIVFGVLIFSYSKFFIEPNVYNIEFKDIDGITKGSPVRFMGINIGHVRALKAGKKRVHVQIIVTKKDMKIPNGTAARVEFYGLGGSKSIELMPPDGSCDVGILTGDTIRIADVAKEATSMVEIFEIIERYVESLNKTGMLKFLRTVKEFKDDKLIEADKSMDKFSETVSKKADIIKEKQSEYNKKIKRINENVEKINSFIKK